MTSQFITATIICFQMTITKPRCEPLGDFTLGLVLSASFKGSQNGRFKVHFCYMMW